MNCSISTKHDIIAVHFLDKTTYRVSTGIQFNCLSLLGCITIVYSINKVFISGFISHIGNNPKASICNISPFRKEPEITSRSNTTKIELKIIISFHFNIAHFILNPCHHMLRLDISIYSSPFSHMTFRSVCTNDDFCMNIKDFTHWFTSHNECSVFFSFKAFRLGFNFNLCTLSCSFHSHMLIKDLTLQYITCIRQIDLVLIKPYLGAIRSNESYTTNFIGNPMRIRFKVQFFKDLLWNPFSTTLRKSNFRFLIYNNYIHSTFSRKSCSWRAGRSTTNYQYISFNHNNSSYYNIPYIEGHKKNFLINSRIQYYMLNTWSISLNPLNI